MPRMGGIVSCLLLIATTAPTQQVPVELSGVWEDPAGNALHISHDGKSVKATAFQLRPETKSTYGFTEGDSTFEATTNDTSLNGKLHLRFEMPWKQKCPDQWDQWTSLTLNASDDRNSLDGQFKNLKLDEKCEVTEGDSVPWYVSRVLYLEQPILSGFVHPAPDKPAVAQPKLPRFFVDETGHASADFGWGDAGSASSINVELIQDGSSQYSVPVNPSTLAPNPNSDGRWATFDLHKILLEQVNLYKQRNVTLRLRLKKSDGSEQTIDSPPLDRYQILEFMKQRAMYLADLLFGRSLPKARLLTADDRRKLAWRRFVRNWKPELSVSAHNRGTKTVFTNYSVASYVLYDEKKWKVPWEEVDSQKFSGPPGNSTIVDFKVNPTEWPDEQVSAVIGFQMIAGEETEQRLKAKAEDAGSLRKMFTLDPFDGRTLGALLINVELEGEEDKAYVAAAEKFLAQSGPSGSSHAGNWKKGHDAAIDWRDLIREFEDLEQLRKDSFARSKMGDLNDKVNDNQKGNTIHIGQPVTRSNQPSLTTAEAEGESFDTLEKYELEMPNSTIFWRGLMSAATQGVAAGDLPLPSDNEIVRRQMREAQLGATTQSDSWQAPKHYVDAFTDLSPSEMSGIMSSLDASQPFSQVKGEVMEGLVARQYARNRVDQLRTAGKNAAFIPGWNIRNYTDAQLSGPGSKMADGLVVSLRDGNLVIENTLEAKAGTAGVEGAQAQLAKHEARIRQDGFAVVNPASEVVGYLQGMGIQPTSKQINKQNVTIYYVPSSRVRFSEARDRQVLFTANDVNSGTSNNTQVSLRKGQIGDLAADLMTRAGLEPTRWNDPMLSLDGYQQYYRNLVPAAQQISQQDLARRYLNGERFNPDTGDWEYVYKGKLQNADPFMGPKEFLDAYSKSLVNPPTDEQLAKAAEKYRDGWRYNADSGWFKPGNLLTPDTPGISPEEYLRIWERSTDPQKRTLTSQQALDRIKSGQFYDWTSSAPNKWRKIPKPEGYEPASDTSLARKYMNADAANAAQLAVDMLNAGAQEAARVRSQHLLVHVRKKKGMPHVFVWVLRGQVNPSTGAVDDDAWMHVGSGVVQKWLLEQWYRGSEGAWTDSGVPAWLRDAKPDGEGYPW